MSVFYYCRFDAVLCHLFGQCHVCQKVQAGDVPTIVWETDVVCRFFPAPMAIDEAMYLAGDKPPNYALPCLYGHDSRRP
jgi:hypothetical protein